MKPLRVLIVNRCIASRTGTEIYVRDLATALQQQGHQPVVFSPRLGPLADELQACNIPVVDRLEAIDEAPDVIHGHHTWETMATLVRFPNVPAIFVGHDSTAWHDTPPKLPQIQRYVAVDYTLHERFIERHEIRPELVSVVANPINFERFQRRGPLPRRPQRALQISGYSGPCEQAEIEAACDARGIHLESVGRHFGNTTTEPEALLGDYDLVFAKGRCAFEAAAVGAAVIVCDTWGCGPMLSSQFLNRGQGILTGRNMMSEVLCKETLIQRIDAYDPDDAFEVSQRIRATFDATTVAERLLEIYREIIANHQEIGTGSHQQALQNELLWWSTHFDQVLTEQNMADARLQPRKLTQFEATVARPCVDFQRPFRGDGWYAPEHDDQGAFCWLGPEPSAWVELLLPTGESFCLQCEVAHTLDSSVLEGLTVRADELPLELSFSTNESLICVSGLLPKAGNFKSGKTVRLTFNLPRTTRPCDLNLANRDVRPLGIALRRIAIESQTVSKENRFGSRILDRLRSVLPLSDAA